MYVFFGCVHKVDIEINLSYLLVLSYVVLCCTYVYTVCVVFVVCTYISKVCTLCGTYVHTYVQCVYSLW